MVMVKIDFTKDFKKQFAKLPPKRAAKVKQAIALFVKNPEHPQLRNHGLIGKWKNHRSIRARGDLRLNFQVNGDTATFVAVGTHSQFYD